MAVATFASRILGLVREQVLAAQFGASGLTDAFTIAFRIPNMLRDLFAEGAFSSAFVPVFTEQKQVDEQAARRLLWSLFVLLGTITLIVSALMALFAEELVYLVTDDLFHSDGERVLVTVQLIRVMSPFLVFVSLAALLMGALNSLRVFFVPALAPAFFNIVMILCMWYLPPFIERAGFHPIMALGVGVIAGGFVQLCMQFPMIFKKAYGPIRPLSFFNSVTAKVVNRLGIGTIGIAATQINILVTTMIATSTVIGAVSWLNYAFRLFQFPVGILSVSIANSHLVHFAEEWKAGRREDALEVLKKSYLLSMLTIAPATALLLALSTESVRLIFERGLFTAVDTEQTAKALMAYGIGLPCYGLYKMLVPTFFTLDKPRIPVLISVAAIGFNLIFCLSLVDELGFVTLAFGTSLSMFFNCGLQSYFLKRDLEFSWTLFLNLRLLKIIVAAGLCFLAAKFTSSQLASFAADSFLAEATSFLLAAAAGAGLYGATLFALGEGAGLKRALKRRG